MKQLYWMINHWQLWSTRKYLILIHPHPIDLGFRQVRVQKRTYTSDYMVNVCQVIFSSWMICQKDTFKDQQSTDFSYSQRVRFITPVCKHFSYNLSFFTVLKYRKKTLSHKSCRFAKPNFHQDEHGIFLNTLAQLLKPFLWQYSYTTEILYLLWPKTDPLHQSY